MSTKKFIRSDTENDTDVCSDFEDERVIKPITHQLLPKWTFWVWKSDETKTSWEDCLHEVFTVNTIEDFCALQHRLVPASKLKSGFDYGYFKKGIKPVWADPKNSKGGMWSVELDKQYRHVLLDKIWAELLMAILGAQFPNCNDLINGAFVKIRDHGDSLCLWVNNAYLKSSNYEIRDFMAEKLGIENVALLTFRKHPNILSNNETIF